MLEQTRSTTQVLVFAPTFVPGSRAGGPIRSLDVLTDADVRGVDFSVITPDRDLGDRRAYEVARRLQWVSNGRRRVLYVNQADVGEYLGAMRMVRRAAPDVYYFNSLWARHSTLIPLLLIWLRILPRRPVLLAPRGELLEGAIASKAGRKQTALRGLVRLTKALGVEFHATSPEELSAIARHFPGRPSHMLQDTSAAPSRSRWRLRGEVLRVVYASRIHPHKNTAEAIRAVTRSGAPARLDLYGAPEVESYVAECRAAAAEAPEPVTVTFHGHVEHDDLDAVLGRSDIFILPTKGENFSHAIREALSAGCVVLTSDATPWSDGLRAAGVATPSPGDTNAFAAEIHRLASMPAAEYAELQSQLDDLYESWRGQQEREIIRTAETMAGLSRS